MLRSILSGLQWSHDSFYFRTVCYHINYLFWIKTMIYWNSFSKYFCLWYLTLRRTSTWKGSVQVFDQPTIWCWANYAAVVELGYCNNSLGLVRAVFLFILVSKWCIWYAAYIKLEWDKFYFGVTINTIRK